MDWMGSIDLLDIGSIFTTGAATSESPRSEELQPQAMAANAAKIQILRHPPCRN